MLIDAHAHLNFQAYNRDRNEVLKRSQNMKVINVGSQVLTSRLALELANKCENMYATVGLHPIHVEGQEHDKNEVREKIDMSEEEQLQEIRELLAGDKKGRIVAVGETGLDYFHLDSQKHKSTPRLSSGQAKTQKQAGVTKRPRFAGELRYRDSVTAKQKEVFLKHIELAKEFNKPLMLHCRGSKENPEEAYNKLLEILISSFQPQAPSITGMLHCFSSIIGIAKKFLDLGFYIGFTGIITFPNAGDLVNVVKQVPLNRILTETDCPYLAPEPVRGQRNEPRYVEYITQEIAKIKGVGYDEVMAKVEENARELFNI